MTGFTHMRLFLRAARIVSSFDAQLFLHAHFFAW